MKKNHKWITLTLAAVLVLGLVATGLVAGAYGGTMDLDGDGKITIHDAQLAREAEIGKRTLTDDQRYAKSDYRSEEIEEKHQGKSDPEDRLNVLLIGNSFSCGLPEELTGMLNAAGIKARVYTVYYPGCSLQQHWNWTSDATPHYRLRHYLQTGGYVTDGYEAEVDGVAKIMDAVDLEYCLAAEDHWDVIALQNHFKPTVVTSYDNALAQTETYAANMYQYLRGKYPDARLVWFETWSYSTQSKEVVTLEKQQAMQEIIHDVSVKVATDNGVDMIPCGGAWYIARRDYDLGDMYRDTLHDGYANGGQYMNACVWFECLTGQSCVGNTYRPTEYTLDDTNSRIQTLQTIAHQAVAENPVKPAN